MPFGRRQQPPPAAPRSAPPNEPARAPSPDVPRIPEAPPLQTDNVGEVGNIVPASNEFVALLVAHYGGRSGIFHPPTVIGAAAALAGEFAQRATGFSVPAKPALVFGPQINDILFRRAARGQATVWQALALAGREAGLAESELPDPVKIAETVDKAVFGPRFPPLTVPEEHYPLEYSPNACTLLRPKVIAIADRYDLSLMQLCLALAMTAGKLIRMTRETFPPAISVRLAAEVAFGVARMAPMTEPIG